MRIARLSSCLFVLGAITAAYSAAPVRQTTQRSVVQQHAPVYRSQQQHLQMGGRPGMPGQQGQRSGHQQFGRRNTGFGNNAISSIPRRVGEPAALDGAPASPRDRSVQPNTGRANLMPPSNFRHANLMPNSRPMPPPIHTAGVPKPGGFQKSGAFSSTKPDNVRFDPAHKVGMAGMAHHHRPFVYRHQGHAFRRAYYYRRGFWYWYDVPIAVAPAVIVDDDGNSIPDCDPTMDECGPSPTPNVAPPDAAIGPAAAPGPGGDPTVIPGEDPNDPGDGGLGEPACDPSRGQC